MTDVTTRLARWNDGDEEALRELLPLVYEELHRLAEHYMLRERAAHTLQPTALVHEAYLRLANIRQAKFVNRSHFYGAAAQAMRRILVEHARQRQAAKRGGGEIVVSFVDEAVASLDTRSDLLALDDALTRLAAVAPRPAKVVELRYFAGMSIDEVAEIFGVSSATVKRHWTFARAWLHRALGGQLP
jgi:RNA polymerase sigma-70 factor (ECF subfamily)